MGIESAGSEPKPKSGPPRPAYKVEELLALRDSVSESAVSLEKFGDEEAIKEHVLRPSVSHGQLASSVPETNKRLAGSENAPVVSNPDKKKPSPSPSVQQRKAEKLIKEHGSPPGVRVTAGGRIVQTIFTPTGSPALPKTMKGNDYPQNSVDDFVYPPNVALYSPPIHHMGMMAPYVPAPYPQHPVMAMPPPNLAPCGIAVPVQPTPYPVPMVPIPFQNCPEPMISIEEAILSTNQRIKELEHALNLHERDMIFRDSFGRKMDPLEKRSAIERKREFVNQMNTLRNQVKYFESEKSNNVHHVSPSILLAGSDARPSTPVHCVGASTTQPLRKSHAVEIKKPQDGQKSAAKSTLDPTSPSYEPKVPSLYTPGSSPENKAVVDSSSGNSTTTFSTTDFFPHNPEEHSMRKYKEPVSEMQVEPPASEATDEKLRNSTSCGNEIRRENASQGSRPASDSTTKVDRPKSKATRLDLDLKLKNKPNSYLYGYIHGLLQHQPDRTEGQEWVQGFCDGLTMSSETIESHKTSQKNSFATDLDIVVPGRPYLTTVPVHYAMTAQIDQKLPENHRFPQLRYPDKVPVQPRGSSIPAAAARYGGNFAPRYPGDRGSGQSAGSIHAIKAPVVLESKRVTPPLQSPPVVPSLTGFAGNAASQTEALEKSNLAIPSPSSQSSPKRSPSKKLEQLTRHFRSSASTEKNSNNNGNGPSSPNGVSGNRNRWREGIGRPFRRHG